MHGKVFLACALGGGIGALVALQMWQPLWWIGLLVGGLVGYLSYEFKAVIRAIPTAAQYAGVGTLFIPFLAFLVARGTIQTILRMPRELGLWSMWSNALPILAAVFYLGGWRAVAAAVAFVLAHIGLCTFMGRLASPDRNTFFDELRRYHLLWSLRACGYYAPLFLRSQGGVATRFLNYLFILIHSELRLLCAFDAAFGAAMGYFLGNAAIGALAGGVIGVLNYEVVSKRLLHLVPSR